MSKYLNNIPYVSTQTAEKIRKAIKELNYKPSIIARSLTTNRTNTIGLIIWEITNPFFPDIIKGVEDYATELGYKILLVDIKDKSELIDSYIDSLKESSVDGIISASNAISKKYINNLRKEKFPFVFVSLSSESDFDYVDIDNFKGAYLITEYLINLGHKKIAHISGDIKTSDAISRIGGYKRALEENGIRIDEKLLIKGDFSEKSGFIGAKKLLSLKQKPTAIFCANDFSAYGALDFITKNGYRVPEDISVAGFDNLYFSSLNLINLTTIDQPRYKMGAIAAEILINKIKNPKSDKRKEIILEPKIIIRKTTKILRKY